MKISDMSLLIKDLSFSLQHILSCAASDYNAQMILLSATDSGNGNQCTN